MPSKGYGILPFCVFEVGVEYISKTVYKLPEIAQQGLNEFV